MYKVAALALSTGLVHPASHRWLVRHGVVCTRWLGRTTGKRQQQCRQHTCTTHENCYANACNAATTGTRLCAFHQRLAGCGGRAALCPSPRQVPPHQRHEQPRKPVITTQRICHATSPGTAQPQPSHSNVPLDCHGDTHNGMLYSSLSPCNTVASGTDSCNFCTEPLLRGNNAIYFL